MAWVEIMIGLWTLLKWGFKLMHGHDCLWTFKLTVCLVKFTWLSQNGLEVNLSQNSNFNEFSCESKGVWVYFSQRKAKLILVKSIDSVKLVYWSIWVKITSLVNFSMRVKAPEFIKFCDWLRQVNWLSQNGFNDLIVRLKDWKAVNWLKLWCSLF